MKQQSKLSFLTLLITLILMATGAACSDDGQSLENPEPLTATNPSTVPSTTATITTIPEPAVATEPAPTIVPTSTATNPAEISDAAIKLIVDPQTAPATAPVTIRLENLDPKQQVVLRSHSVDWRGMEWEANGVWIADGSGTIDLTLQAPIEGSYAGVDGMGLFWSMLPIEKVDNPFFFGAGNSYPVEISAEINQQTVTTMTVIRENFPSTVRSRELRGNGLIGAFYYPAADGPHPAILLLGGSEGGLNRQGAAARAEQGYATLSLGYHGIDPMPELLSELPLETFSQGLDWLKAQPEVDSERLAITGLSRGSEAAMLTAINHPEIVAVIALAPSSIVWPGLDFSTDIPKSAWTLAGEPVPFNSYIAVPEAIEASATQPSIFTPMYEAAMQNAPADAFIAVEQINAPILLISGTQDQLWPATTFANQIETRLKSSNFAYPIENLILSDAGHLFRSDYMPPASASQSLAFGGTREGNASGGVQSWQAQLAFLNTYLRAR